MSKHYQRLSVPGNLLLLGEYVVLEEGGQGLTCAVEPRVTCHWRAHSHWRIEAHYPDGEFYWQPDGPSSPFFESAWKHYKRLNPASSQAYALTLDSRALGHAHGGTLGLGSSAAAMVALTAALLYLHQKQVPLPSQVFELTLAAHRYFQGGHGSGYDVACSTFGGWGLFTGGVQPHYQTRDQHLPLPLFLITAPHPVSTPQAISRWQQWRQAHAQDWQEHVTKTQTWLQALCTSATPASFIHSMQAAAQGSQQLGKALGVWESKNEIQQPSSTEASFYKALGAGNELYLTNALSTEARPLTVAVEGLVWS